MIKHHTDLLNYLIKKYDLKSYLEIGVQNPANNFLKIICQRKMGVDPETNHPMVEKVTSDDFFEHYKTVLPFDLIFIDGLHTAEQVEKDFNNSLNCLSDKGFIVIHDCLPVDEITTLVPRQSKIWHGDVYKFIMRLHTIDGIRFSTFDFDHGCCIVQKHEGMKGIKHDSDFTWPEYLKHGNELLRIKKAEELEAYI